MFGKKEELEPEPVKLDSRIEISVKQITFDMEGLKIELNVGYHRTVSYIPDTRKESVTAFLKTGDIKHLLRFNSTGDNSRKSVRVGEKIIIE